MKAFPTPIRRYETALSPHNNDLSLRWKKDVPLSQDGRRRLPFGEVEECRFSPAVPFEFSWK